VKKAALILFAAVIAATAALLATRCLLPRQSSQDWLRSEFHLTPEKMQTANELHAGYQKTCEEMCRRIAATDDRLAAAVRSSNAITPEIVAAIAETDRVRTECRIAMLDHFYQTAALMTGADRQRYLEKVLPVVLHPGEMHDEHMR